MKNKLFLTLALSAFLLNSCNAQLDTTQTKTNNMETKYNPLSDQEKNVILNKATDRPYTGDYYKKSDKGVYVCRQCNNPLYTSEDKFDSHCGWPSFDQEIKGSVTRIPDADGSRTEIVCNNCQGHLGHVFLGEGFTSKDTRHCVNTSSLLFYPLEDKDKIPAIIK